MLVANFLAPIRRSMPLLPLLMGFALIAGISLNGASLAMSKSRSPSVNTPVQTSSAANSSSRIIWVQKPDGAVSCEADKGQALEIGQKELRQAGIEVYSSRKGNDGQMHIQMCGAPQGTFNFFEIRESDLTKAIGLGFARALKRPD